MKQLSACRCIKVLIVILLVSISGLAQQPQDLPTKDELALEVNSGVRSPWGMPIFRVGGGSGLQSFRRIESWKPSKGEAPVVDIYFNIDREEETLIAQLSVRLENEKQVIVGEYRLKEGETTETAELTKFGVEPLTLKVVTAQPHLKDPVPPTMPRLENKTNVVEIVSFEQGRPPFDDGFQLSLRNVSNKTIIGLDLFMPSADGNGGYGQRSQVRDNDTPVMLPGGMCVRYIALSTNSKMTPSGPVRDVPVQQTLFVRTVVFDDGTYEGDVEPAAEMIGQRRGLDIQRGRILDLLRKGDTLTLEELKEATYALDKTADPNDVPNLLARFPALDDKANDLLLRSLERGLTDGKLEMLRSISEVQVARKPGEKDLFAEWLKQTLAKYEKLAAAP